MKIFHFSEKCTFFEILSNFAFSSVSVASKKRKSLLKEVLFMSNYIGKENRKTFMQLDAMALYNYFCNPFSALTVS